MDSIRMRRTVTVLTFWNHFVFGLMTGNTCNIMVLGRARLEESICLVMAGSTLDAGNIFTIDDSKRLVGFMTSITVSLDNVV